MLMESIKDWANIIEDLACREDDILILDCDVIDFDQTWGSTALGFSGMGGQIMTTERTYIIVYTNRAYVYFGGRYATHSIRRSRMIWRSTLSLPL